MKVLLDSSVLVAALLEAHPDHGPSRSWLRRARAGEVALVVAAHSLVETFSVLTRLPLRPRVAPATARAALRESVSRHATVATLTARETESVLDRLAERALGGGLVYDALVIRVAEKAGVERLLTWNLSHFRRLWPDAGDRLAAP